MFACRAASKIQGESLEDQLAMCRAYIARMGWTEYQVYIEPGRSAFTEKLDKRIAFQELRADAKAGKFQAVLVYKMNRFARKAFIQYQVAAEFDRYKVEIASATEPIDRKTANGRLTFGVLAVIAEAQSDGLSEVMRDKRLNEAKKGRHVGQCAGRLRSRRWDARRKRRCRGRALGL
jgi:site-specific DNA recombinase